MKVLIIGGGGREHALAWKLAQSPKLEKLFVAPGNPGMEEFANRVPVRVTDMDDIVGFALRQDTDLVVVGPEMPLAMGLADRLRERDILCFGPGAEGARLESSKKYARAFMEKHGIPSPRWESFRSAEEAERSLSRWQEGPVVVKADGLAQGKGVVVAPNRAEALAAVREILDGRFGDAGNEVLIEECLTGPEVSLLAFTDGKTLLPMLPARDHKRAGDGDTGPNTGGMGACSPAPAYTPEIACQVRETILDPLERALASEEIDYRGCLYIGLMLTPGGPKVIEFNSRFGDPETQALMPLLESDLLDILCACARGHAHKNNQTLEGRVLQWHEGSAACVVLTSRGYPGEYAVGRVIRETGSVSEDVKSRSWIFHSGTDKNAQGDLLTAGGRVLSVTARGATLDDALKAAYARVASLSFEGCAFRTDIGRG